MTLHSYSNVIDFLAEVQDTLELNEAVNSLTLGIALSIKPDATSPYFSAVHSGGALTAVALMTPPYNMQIAVEGDDNREALEIIARDILASRGNIPGVVGRAAASLAFAEIYCSLAGATFAAGMQMRLYRLDSVVWPDASSGNFRIAVEDDTDLLAEWCAAFSREAVPHDPPFDAHKAAARKIANKELFIWEDGKPVAMAARARPTRNGTTVNYVYTPPEFRGRGYASACVAALSQHLLDNGNQFCVLFTDLANPTSNSIYQRIGYKPICDFTAYHFSF